MIEAGVLPGVLLAIELSVALAVSRSALPRDAALGDAPGLQGWVDLEEFPTVLATDGLVGVPFRRTPVLLQHQALY